MCRKMLIAVTIKYVWRTVRDDNCDQQEIYRFWQRNVHKIMKEKFKENLMTKIQLAPIYVAKETSLFNFFLCTLLYLVTFLFLKSCSEH